MNITTINALGNLIDNVYHKTSDGSRKIVTKLSGNTLSLTFQSIINFGRESGLHVQTRAVEGEANQLINDTVATIKKTFKEVTSKGLRLERLGQSDQLETISTNPFTPRRIIKYSLTVNFEIIE